MLLLLSVALTSCDTRRESPTSEESINKSANLDATQTESRTSEKAEVPSSNVGGTVMTPSRNIIQNITAGEKLATLGALLNKSGLVETLNASGPYTLFAPTEEAFENLPGGAIEDLMKPENKQRLTEILNNHVVAGKLSSADLKNGTILKTAGGKQLEVSNREGKIMINGASVEAADGISSNGVIHVVDKVLMPEEKDLL